MRVAQLVAGQPAGAGGEATLAAGAAAVVAVGWWPALIGGRGTRGGYWRGRRWRHWRHRCRPWPCQRRLGRAGARAGGRAAVVAGRRSGRRWRAAAGVASWRTLTRAIPAKLDRVVAARGH